MDVERPGVRAGRGEILAARLHEGRWHVGIVGALAVLMGSLCMQPLLDGAWWVMRTVVVVVVIVGVGGVARSLRMAAPLIPLLQFAALVVTLALLFARDEARWGLVPGPASLARLRELASQGRDYSMATVPPAGADPGLLLLIVAGIGLAALVVDTLGAGLDLPGMTLIPLAALFAVPWLVNRGWAPWWAFPLVALGWLALLSALQRERASHWSPGARAGSPGVALAIAGATTALALVAGGLATLRGPAEPIDIGSGSGGGTVEVDALVSLRRSLVSNDTRPVITLATTATRPEYLRLSILELFDGEQWQPVGPNATGPQPPARADGSVPSAEQPPGVPLAEYQLDVGPLGGTTLPSPNGSFQSLTDWPVVWDQRTSLPLRADGDSVEGARIGLVATAQDLDADSLRAASTVPPTPEQVFGENLADPAPLTGEELPQLARDITAGSATPFDAAIALQNWFTTDGGFAYSTQIEGGSDEDALATFLDERVGYCEQFAATMALMARSVGIPARVVVGFTQGRLEGNQWVVRGTDAHAWPELWMGSAGWVRFEPTPGAPTTTTPGYTSAVPSTAGPTAQPTQSSAAPTASDTGVPAQVPDEAAGASGEGQSGSEGLPVRRILVVLVLIGILVPAAVRLVRRRRRTRSGDGDAAYREVVDTMVDLQLGWESSTPRSTLTAVQALVGAGAEPAPESGEVQQALTRILRAVEWQRYGSPGAGSGAAVVPGGVAAPGGVAVPGAAAGGVMVAERQVAAHAVSRPGALAGDVRIVRRALARRAGWVRRAVAVLVPRSVVIGLAARAANRGGAGAG
jgi:transglutaminase-like putative cysteine protease